MFNNYDGDLQCGSDLERENEVTGMFSGPGRAEITRQRTVRLTGGKYGRRGKSDTKNVSLHDRVAVHAKSVYQQKKAF